MKAPILGCPASEFGLSRLRIAWVSELCFGPWGGGGVRLSCGFRASGFGILHRVWGLGFRVYRG